MEKLKAYFREGRGRKSQLALELEITPSALTQWKEVPAERVLKVESLTGISRFDLRPDVFGSGPKVKPKAAA